MTLTVRQLRVSYGALAAVDDVDLDIEGGTIVGMIGPNGAGKTSFIDAASGFVAATGSVVVDAVDVSGASPARRARAGLVRTWQSVEPFPNLSVEQNLWVGATRASLSSVIRNLGTRRGSAERDALQQRIDAALAVTQLRDQRDAPAAGLSLGAMKRLGIARALAAGPRYLLLDEPAAGLDVADTALLGGLLSDVASTGVGILLVDHDVELVLGICSSVAVMDIGRRIALGPPAAIRADRRVLDVYLGRTA